MPTAEDPLVANHARQISEFVAATLGDYVAKLKSSQDSGASFRAKEFNDPVWGTVALQAQEVIVLDSPLLQRLRRVRQLGVAHLVYPGAVHTRLEHSIGVCHQVGRLAESINVHKTDLDGTAPSALDDRVVRLLRLTGLCHDIGHGLMSHVVENSLKNYSECQDLIRAFKRHLGSDSEPQLSEIAAYCMIRSDSFAELLRAAYLAAGLNFDPNMPVEMAGLVVGMSATPGIPQLHELISGPFDADKLDYMPRDARMCGVPVVTDINRLIQKVRATQISEERLPEELGRIVEPGRPLYTVVGLAPSGASTLDEVAIGRSLMFDKIYRHHKVRSAEAMVAAIIDQVGRLLSADLNLLPLRVYDEEFLTLTSTSLAARAQSEGTCSSEISVAADIIQRLADRRLFVRAFAFTQYMPGDPYRGRPDHHQAVEQMCRETNDPSSRGRFVAKTAEVAARIVDSLKLTIPGFTYPSAASLRPYIWVDSPASSTPEGDADTNHAYVIGHDGVPRQVAQINPATRGWSDAYINTRDMGYVFTIRELALVVHIASEVAALHLYGARIHDQMRIYSKQHSDTLNDCRRALEKAGFYDDEPAELRPLAKVLEKAATRRDIDSWLSTMQGYEPPGATVAGVLAIHSLSFEHVRDWIHQFHPKFAEFALATVLSIRLIGRRVTDSALMSFLADPQYSRFQSASFVPLGGAQDGSAVVGYYARTVSDYYEGRVRGRDEALVRDDPIVFVDDFAGRGSTAISFFEGLFGVEDSQGLSQERPGPVTDAAAAILRNKPVALVFSAGLEGARDTIYRRLNELGMGDLTVYVHTPVSALPRLEEIIPATVTFDGESITAGEFVDECRRIGKELLSDGTHTSTWVDERSLGYGNHGLLVAFPYNTPTATLSCLWRSGTVNGHQWRPLVPRMKKT